MIPLGPAENQVLLVAGSTNFVLIVHTTTRAQSPPLPTEPVSDLNTALAQVAGALIHQKVACWGNVLRTAQVFQIAGLTTLACKVLACLQYSLWVTIQVDSPHISELHYYVVMKAKRILAEE